MVGPPPLQGLKVLEFAGLAPGPFAGMLLADAGADVLRIDRPVPVPSAGAEGGKANPPPAPDMLARRKRSIAVDLKSAAGIRLVKALARTADVLIEPFRPGVMERLGLGPDALCADAPRLVYARMAGFRRDGRYAAMAGHDINYLAVSGALSLLGRAGQPPHPPANILGDFAGGGAMLVLGVLTALVARERGWSRPGGGDGDGDGKGRRGQVVEANMVDGANYLATFPRLSRKTPAVGGGPRGTNLLDGGCPFYDTYETRDDGSGERKYVAVGALEPQFFRALVKGLGLAGKGLLWAEDDEKRRHDSKCWPEMRREFEKAFRTKTRDEWEAVFDGTDACCTPVLGYAELEAAAGAGAGDGNVGGGSGRTRREGDQRPPVTLRGTPWLAIAETADDTAVGGGGKDEAARTITATTIDPVVRGQGPGVPGGGYVGTLLAVGQGGEEALAEWLGWEKGTHFEVEDGGLVLLTEAENEAGAGVEGKAKAKL
ncbi:hypothetical protein SLS62_000760 [Diatrype stigma]|uniref:Alpha-methylacyl-CoA racemase n=1 Tax=Diatrype stigma TaxID=117547 RepID=A0AAN9V0E8_9PEZI